MTGRPVNATDDAIVAAYEELDSVNAVVRALHVSVERAARVLCERGIEVRTRRKPEIPAEAERGEDFVIDPDHRDMGAPCPWVPCHMQARFAVRAMLPDAGPVLACANHLPRIIAREARIYGALIIQSTEQAPGQMRERGL